MSSTICLKFLDYSAALDWILVSTWSDHVVIASRTSESSSCPILTTRQCFPRKQTEEEKEYFQNWRGIPSSMNLVQSLICCEPAIFVVVAGADPGFYLGGGALVSCSTSTPINHNSFFCRIPAVLENRSSSRGGGVRTPCTLPLDPPLCCWRDCARPKAKRHETSTKFKKLVNGKRISIWNVPTGKTGLPFQNFRLSGGIFQ